MDSFRDENRSEMFGYSVSLTIRLMKLQGVNMATQPRSYKMSRCSASAIGTGRVLEALIPVPIVFSTSTDNLPFHALYQVYWIVKFIYSV